MGGFIVTILIKLIYCTLVRSPPSYLSPSTSNNVLLYENVPVCLYELRL
jgi:hypothetical protein